MSNNKVEFISVVVPVYNEEGCLEELIRRSLAALEKTERRYELILIDDGSRDRSPEIMTAASEANPDKVISCFLNRNYGQHSAIMAGFSLVRGDLIITIDADLQNPPEEFGRLVEAAEQGNDVVGTIRQNRKDSILRTLPSKIVNKAAQAATGVKMHDYGCMLRAYRRHVENGGVDYHSAVFLVPMSMELCFAEHLDLLFHLCGGVEPMFELDIAVPMVAPSGKSVYHHEHEVDGSVIPAEDTCGPVEF